MSEVDARLYARAQAITPADPGVQACWYMVVNGVRAGWLDAGELPAVIEQLRNEADFGIEELLFEHRGDEVQVSFLGDDVRCDRAALCAQLELLAAPPKKRTTVVPAAAREAIHAALRPESDHADALPDPLYVNKLLFLVDKAKASTEQIRARAGQDDQGYFLDYYRLDNRGETSWHGRIRDTGVLERLENVEGELGTRWFPDPADTQRELLRVGAHNDRVREILRQKGFV